MTISSPVKSEESKKEKSPETPQSKNTPTPASVKAEADTTSEEVTSKPNNSIFGGTPSKTVFEGKFFQVWLCLFLSCFLLNFF